MHHGVSELVAQEPPELRGVAAEHLRDLLGVEAREPASQMRARLVINPHRVAGGEFAVNLHDAASIAFPFRERDLDPPTQYWTDANERDYAAWLDEAKKKFAASPSEGVTVAATEVSKAQ